MDGRRGCLAFFVFAPVRPFARPLRAGDGFCGAPSEGTSTAFGSPPCAAFASRCPSFLLLLAGLGRCCSSSLRAFPRGLCGTPSHLRRLRCPLPLPNPRRHCFGRRWCWGGLRARRAAPRDNARLHGLLWLGLGSVDARRAGRLREPRLLIVAEADIVVLHVEPSDFARNDDPLWFLACEESASPFGPFGVASLMRPPRLAEQERYSEVGHLRLMHP
ncbi:hypothetical protein OH77DRAFT_1068520 [Trametes cingulata]|nr:hypothetical protein OH77DRAFT_1068520 [Trametes cingulata]